MLCVVTCNIRPLQAKCRVHLWPQGGAERPAGASARCLSLNVRTSLDINAACNKIKEEKKGVVSLLSFQSTQLSTRTIQQPPVSSPPLVIIMLKIIMRSIFIVLDATLKFVVCHHDKFVVCHHDTKWILSAFLTRRMDYLHHSQIQGRGLQTLR